MADFTTLESIFRMTAPGDLFGVSKNVLGTSDRSSDTVVELMKTLFDQQGGGAVSADQLLAAFKRHLGSAKNPDSKKQFHKAINFYSSVGHFTEDKFDWHTKVLDPTRDELVKVEKLEPIVGIDADELSKKDKKMAVVLSNSSYITPAVRKAPEAEIFLNFMPSVIMSRCVPYLSVEMVFDRPAFKIDGGDPGNTLAAPGLLRFLLGAQAVPSDGGANDLMLRGSTVSVGSDSATKEQRMMTIAGMEMFTSPQTLVNPTPVPEGSRYVPILDPFRPFATLEGATINVTPTVGLYSYKKATLTLKLHDRSRLSEIADFIQPLVYTKTTVWLTYGWRHPPEPNNPYAKFINDNMLVREPYGIVNSQFSFDQVGQVQLTLELYTKGVRELIDLRLTNSSGFNKIKREITEAMENIVRYRRQLKLDSPSGLNKEVRGFQLLDAAERGEFPDLNEEEISSAIASLDKSLKSGSGKLDSAAANSLISELKKIYAFTGSKKDRKFNYNARFEKRSEGIVSKLISNLQATDDPFLIGNKKYEEKKTQLGLSNVPDPLVAIVESYNTVPQTKKPGAQVPQQQPQQRSLVSFGKVFSTILGRSLINIPSIDEMQIFFYNFNDHAGNVSGKNIAEFPVDMNVLKLQLSNHIAQRKTDAIALEEFIQLVVNAQLGDVRGVGYGLSSYFETFDPKNPDPVLKNKDKKSSQEEYENAVSKLTLERGPFHMPVIDVHVESTYATTEGKKIDLLDAFELAALRDARRRSDNYARIVRVHVFDKQANPYPFATSMLKADDKLEISSIGTIGDLQKKGISFDQSVKDIDLVNGELQVLQGDLELFTPVTQDENGRIFFIKNPSIKQLVAKLIPTIVYGGNASSIISANVASQHDPLLGTVQMMANKAGRPSATQPNGGGTMGLPLRVLPSTVSLTTLGCPLLSYAQMFFVDFNTGTTVDNVYGVTGLIHNIGPGKFETVLNMTWYDSYGRYESAPALLLKNFADLQVPG